MLLAKYKLNQSEFARETGISQPTINNLYHNKLLRIDIRTLERICNYFNCGIDDLLTFVEEKEKINIEKAMPLNDQEAYKKLESYRKTIASISEEEKMTIIKEAWENV